MKIDQGAKERMVPPYRRLEVAILAINTVIAACGVMVALGTWLVPQEPQRTVMPPVSPVPRPALDVNLNATETPATTAEATAPEAPLVPTQTSVPPEPSVTPTAPALPLANGQVWRGPHSQYNYGTYPMVLHIEAAIGSTFSGKIHWPELSNSITTIQGYVVEDVSNVVEQSKWTYVPGFNSNHKRPCVKFTDTAVIQGGDNFILNGWYYACISEERTMRGVYFEDAKVSEPLSEFVLSLES